MKWISVGDKLPEQDETVLCWGDTEQHRWGKAVRKVTFRRGSFVRWYQYCDKKCELGLQYVDVTHWMPLPEGPDGTKVD